MLRCCAVSQVRTAQQDAGQPFASRQYGAAIFRAHLPRFGYAPHIDSVRHRERRTGYAVHRHDTQLGGIILLQAPKREALVEGSFTPGYTQPCPDYHDAIIYNAPYSDPSTGAFIDAHTDFKPGGAAGQLRTDAFREHCASTRMRSAPIDLAVGDMYFFKADSVHEIPAFTGDYARMNLATFIGYDEEGTDTVSVWS